MRTIYRAGILTAALMVLVLGGCSSFDRGGEEMASVARPGRGCASGSWMQVRGQMQY
ncbi:MAG: hypothetical protein ACLTBV_32080 [Enterocloster bolteae]